MKKTHYGKMGRSVCKLWLHWLWLTTKVNRVTCKNCKRIMYKGKKHEVKSI